MAARNRKVELTDTWKDGIRVSHIMKRLYDHATGDHELMTVSQINAAKVILSKLVPDLARTEVAGDQNNPIKVEAEVQAEKLLGAILTNVELRSQADD